MKNWTTQAEQRLTHYLDERTRREGFEGEEAAELKDDLRRHIHEEAERSASEVIGLMNLENILGKLEVGYLPPVEERAMTKYGYLPETQPNPRGGFLAWAFGVILPLGVLIFEMLTAFCGSTFFSPVPTWWHAAWLAAVPLLNMWLIRGGGSGGDRGRGAATGFALATAGFYALLFLPLIPYAVIAVIFFGLGLLPLTPLLATILSWRIGKAVRCEAADPARFKSGRRMGMAAALMVLLVLEGPALWTRGNLYQAMGPEKNSEAAIARLRTWHSERTLLNACYEGNRGMRMATDLSGWMCFAPNFVASWFDHWPESQLDSEAARKVFFRVTGKPFNSVKPPGRIGETAWFGGRRAFEEFEFDSHLGGDDVAVRLKNLDLAESRFDGHFDSASRLGYGEWTMVFRNDSPQAKEARCQVRLPRGGRVSRLTLWVNGEPREAAFSTVSKVKAAYKSVAVVQRKDPVLVNMVGPDTVMVQCFPVPPNGKMKIRFGVTAPLDGTRWELPRIVERNFGVTESLELAVWLQGDLAFKLTGMADPVSSINDGGGQSLSTALPENDLMGSGISVNTAALPNPPPVVWCEDKFAKPEERFLIRESSEAIIPAAGNTVVVIDGSLSINPMKDRLLQALGSSDAKQFSFILADDGAKRVTLDELKQYRFSGGRNNEPALREAIRMARENNGGVVWIHGPQAVGLSQTEALVQLLERGTIHPDIHDIDAVRGPNRLAEAIYQTGCLRRGPSLAGDGKEFDSFLDGLEKERRETTWNWKRSANSECLTGTRVWDQLARFWAADAAENPKSGLADAARSELAARYQMVTPVSGAVVLETQQQYAENGLTPGDPSASPGIPNVPEPSTSMLILISTTAALLRRRRPTYETEN